MKIESKIDLTKINLLKSEISTEFKTKGISDKNRIVFKSKAEKYRISLIKCLEFEGCKNISSFFEAYQKILDNYKMPLFKIELVILIYSIWKKYPGFIDNFNVLVKRNKLIINSEDFWKQILIGCNKNKVNNFCHFDLLSLIISKIEWNEKSNQYIPYLIDIVFNLPHFNIRTNKTIIKNENYDQLYEQLFIWIRWIFKNYKYITSEDKLFCIIRLIFLFPKSTFGRDNFKDKTILLNLLNLLKHKFSLQFICNTHSSKIDTIYFCYTNNPSFFNNQKNISYINDELESNNQLELIHIFFKRYHFPTILLENFKKLTSSQKDWLKHVLDGKNLRTYSALPIRLSKKGSHIFCNLLSGFLDPILIEELKIYNLSVTDYLIYSQLRANNVSHNVTLELLKKKFDKTGKKTDFWIETITLLYNQGLNPTGVSSVFDYINYKIVRRNEKLNLKGKTMPNLMNEVNEWHNELAEKKCLNLFGNIKFKEVEINGFEYELFNQKFKIKRILTGYELYKEGKQLHHCVYSYLESCKSNNCLIFSLRIIDEKNKEKRLLTIEIRNKSIYQIRGDYNRQYSNYEFEIIKLWASSENLKIAV